MWRLSCSLIYVHGGERQLEGEKTWREHYKYTCRNISQIKLKVDPVYRPTTQDLVWKNLFSTSAMPFLKKKINKFSLNETEIAYGP